jgi:hypothetical protein
MRGTLPFIINTYPPIEHRFRRIDIQMSQILLHDRGQHFSGLLVLRDADFLRVPRVGFVGEGVGRVDLAGVDVGDWDAAWFGGRGAVGLGAGVGHHDSLVEILVEVFVLFLPMSVCNAQKTRRSEGRRAGYFGHVGVESRVEAEFGGIVNDG